jgi:hypothetical protein
MNRADAIADLLLELMDKPHLTGGRSSVKIGEVLAAALDEYELARLYAVASDRLGRSSAPDPYRYCPWCQAEFDQVDWTEHLETVHRRMLEA